MGTGMGPRVFAAAVEAPVERSSSVWWFAFQGDRLLVIEDGESATIAGAPDPAAIGLEPIRSLYLGRLDGQDCYAVDLAPEASAPAGMVPHGLRALYGRLPDDLFAVAGCAVQLLVWDRTHQFCGRCGTPTESLPSERARQCPACGLRAYPRISPAIIVLVTRGDQLLLTRGHSFPEGFYGVLAGFVEAGESLEETLVREVEEEVGIAVRDIRYFGSQPWPYPHQLMIGFNARWAAGEIQVDPKELADAGWFTRETLPQIPPRLSIARRLIDAFLAGRGTT